jgi:ABC-type dipeptide/oligopeptide/nickel transport system permease subunit
MSGQLNPKGASPVNSPEESEVEKLRIQKAFWLSVIGLVLAASVLGMLLLARWSEASDISTIVGLFTSVLGTIVGVFLGNQMGSAGKEDADKRANETQKTAKAVLAAADKDTIDRAKELYPGLFK